MNSSVLLVKRAAWLYIVLLPFALFATYLITLILSLSRGSDILFVGGCVLGLYLFAIGGVLLGALYSKIINGLFVKSVAAGYLGLIVLIIAYIFILLFPSHW